MSRVATAGQALATKTELAVTARTATGPLVSDVTLRLGTHNPSVASPQAEPDLGRRAGGQRPDPRAMPLAGLGRFGKDSVPGRSLRDPEILVLGIRHHVR